MSGQGIAQIVVYVVVLVALAYPLGMYMARVFGTPEARRASLAAIERGFYRLVRTDPKREQDWKSYAQDRRSSSASSSRSSSTRSSGCRGTCS